MIIVTGSSRGIGNYIANALSYKGINVIGISRTEPSQTTPFFYKTIEGEIPARTFKTYIGDVTNKKDLNRIYNELKDNNITIDALINCAGIGEGIYPDFLTMQEDHIKNIIETNILGTIYTCQTFIPLMNYKIHTPIINMCSLSAHINTELAVYGASKSAIYSFTRSLSKRLATTMIRPNCISPGLIDTDMIKDMSPILKSYGIKKQTIDKMFTKKDIYNIVEFLLNPSSNSITGQTFHIGGI